MATGKPPTSYQGNTQSSRLPWIGDKADYSLNRLTGTKRHDAQARTQLEIANRIPGYRINFRRNTTTTTHNPRKQELRRVPFNTPANTLDTAHAVHTGCCLFSSAWQDWPGGVADRLPISCLPETLSVLLRIHARHNDQQPTTNNQRPTTNGLNKQQTRIAPHVRCCHCANMSRCAAPIVVPCCAVSPPTAHACFIDKASDWTIHAAPYLAPCKPPSTAEVARPSLASPWRRLPKPPASSI